MYPVIRQFRFITIFIVLMVSALACSNSTLPFIETKAPAENSEPSEGISESTTQPEPESPTQPPPSTRTPAPTKEPAAEVADMVPSRDLDEIFEPFWEAREYLHDYYVNQPISDADLASGAFAALHDFATIGTLEISDALALEFSDAAGTPREVEEIFLFFWKTWANASGESEVNMMQVALAGMVAALGDQYTVYFDPDRQIQANINLEGTYEGIGAFVDTDAEFLTIISPIPESPAEKAGLQSGDQIIAIDGDDMTGIDGNLVIRRVLGPAGSEVVLTIRRDGVEEPFDVPIIRATITFPNLSGEILEEHNLAYVQLFNFSPTAGQELRELLAELLAQDPEGLIFDLRGNPGGILGTAIEVVSEFIPDGVVMYERYGDGSQDIFEATGDGLATEIPLVILVDEGSASASEIVAGTIQDYGRAPLVGMTTFGKGSVQALVTLVDEGGLRITLAKWYTSGERQISGSGLTPDFIVEVTEADAEAGIDPQLDKAIEILTGSE